MTGFMRALPGDPCLNTEKYSKRVLLLKGRHAFFLPESRFFTGFRRKTCSGGCLASDTEGILHMAYFAAGSAHSEEDQEEGKNVKEDDEK